MLFKHADWELTNWARNREEPQVEKHLQTQEYKWTKLLHGTYIEGEELTRTYLTKR